MHMETSNIRLKLSAFNFINLLFVTGIFAVSWIFYYNNIITWSYQYKGNLAITFLFLTVYFLFVKIYDAFGMTTHRKLELAISQGLAALFSDCIMFVVVCLLYEDFATLWPILLVLIVQCLFILLWVIWSKAGISKPRPLTAPCCCMSEATK